MTSTPTSNTTTVTLPPVKLYLSAIPDYPVSEGQTVALHCREIPVPDKVIWKWKKLDVTGDNDTWTEVGSGPELSLTRPEQSGQYRCWAQSLSTEFNESNVHTVYIVSVHTTAVDHLGIAGFVFSLLAFILNLAVVFWLLWQRFSATPTLPSTTKDHSITNKAMDVARQAESEQDMYMNYTCTDEDYTDLNPSTSNENSVYSSLS